MQGGSGSKKLDRPFILLVIPAFRLLQKTHLGGAQDSFCRNGAQTMTKVLIACEFSGIVRQEFEKLGYDAMSCDLLPSEIPGNHYQGNVFDILDNGFDLLIAHPPCQYLSRAASHVWDAPGRKALREKAFDFFMKLYNCQVPHICCENPRGYVNEAFRPANQVIHPYYFGDPYKKRTCLWLKNLPHLDYEGLPLFNVPGTIIAEPPMVRFKNKKVNWTESVTGSNRQQIRSKTFPGIARAMAEQWSVAAGLIKCEVNP